MSVRTVAFARTAGSGGEDVAHRVAELTGYRYIDYEVVQRAAQEAGVSPEVVSESEHRGSLLRRLMDALAQAPMLSTGELASPMPMTSSALLTSRDYRAFVEGVLRELAEAGGAVIVGHGSAVVLRSRPDVLRVLVNGSIEKRADRLAKQMQVPDEEARKSIAKTDGGRIEYFSAVYGEEWLSPDAYDVCINTDKLGVEQAAQLVAQLTRTL